MKRLFTLLMLVAMMMGTGLSAYAEGIGTVDWEKLIRSYNKAQSFSDETRIREQEIEKMRAEFVKQLRDAKTANASNPVALEKMEKDLEGQLAAKVNATRDWMAQQSKTLETELNTAIESVAKTKALDVVVAKQFVFHGGTDITNEVLGRLNK